MNFHRATAYLTSISWLAIAAGGALAQLPTKLQIPLFPEFDQFGNQFEVVQAYENGAGQRSITAGIYDTGASVVTFSALDQEFFFEFQGYPVIPAIPGAVATADAIGGSLTGKVSQPGRILAAGASALNIDFVNFTFSYDLANAVSIGGIQAFLGTSTGSPNLPSIVGTPMNVPSATNPNGLATIMDQTGYTINLGDLDPAFGNIPFDFPDVRFVAPGTALAPTSETYESVTIPMSLYGVDNTASPGNEISAAPNPVQPSTGVTYTPSAGGPALGVANQTFLFDTGAQLSVISPAIASQLGLTDIDGNPIETPFDVIDVQGAGNSVTGLPGYILDTLTVPRSDGGTLEFTDVPVYVLDIGFGIDGILGMNLFNGADSFVYDPYHADGPQVSALFLRDRTEEEVIDEAGEFVVLEDPDLAIANAIIGELGLRYAVGNPVNPGVAPDSTLTLLSDVTQTFPNDPYAGGGDINILADSTYTLTGITPPGAGASLITAVQAGLGFELDGEFAIQNFPGGFLDLPNDSLSRRLSVLYEGRAADGSGLVDTMKIGIAQPGDLDFDGDVDFDDAFMLVNNYGITSGATWRDGDFNGDGAVNFDDAFDQVNYYGGTYAGLELLAGLGIAVPEPTSLTLLGVGLLGFLRIRRGRRK